ncbi:MAG TPA: tetratricopeptide repeat protein, partial [Vicinamibacteria bacterium]
SDDDVLFYNLGLLYSRKGLLVEAYDAFRRSHSINPRSLSGTPEASAGRRIDEVRRELESMAAIEPPPAGERAPPSGPHPPLVQGRELELLHAIGRVEQDSVRVLATPKGARARAFVSGVQFPASSGDYVEIDVDAPPDVELYFLWSTEEAKDSVHGLPLPRGWGAATTIALGAEAEWRGRIDGVGVGWTGPSRDPIEIRSLKLRSDGALASLWGEWTGFEGLSGHSMNFVIGGPRLASRYLRPVPTLGLSLVAALAGYGVACRSRSRRVRPRVVVALALGAWLAADARWNVDLWRQLRLTHHRYAGKSWQEKRLSAEDGELFRFAMDVKEALPQAPQVIFLVTRDPESADRYLALRSRYHLLPHNVNANYWFPPGPSEIRPGQYVLVFGPRPDVSYDEGARRLRWSPGGAPRGELEVERILSSSLATLYRKR